MSLVFVGVDVCLKLGFEYEFCVDVGFEGEFCVNVGCVCFSLFSSVKRVCLLSFVCDVCVDEFCSLFGEERNVVRMLVLNVVYVLVWALRVNYV